MGVTFEKKNPYLKLKYFEAGEVALVDQYTLNTHHFDRDNNKNKAD